MKVKIKYLLAIQIALIGFTAVTGFSYNESAPDGPSNWGNANNSCNGKIQSPIDLDTKSSFFTNFPKLEYFNFDLKPNNVTIMNSDNHVKFILNYNSGRKAVIIGGPLTGLAYVVDSFHVHWGENDTVGSEHTRNKKSFPAELHIVTYNLKYGTIEKALNYSDGLAVLGFFYEISSIKAPSSLLEDVLKLVNKNSNFKSLSKHTFFDHLGNVTEYNSNYTITGKYVFSMEDVIGKETDNYFTYKGSLTTPNCAEVVTWIFMNSTLKATSENIHSLRWLKDSKNNTITRNYRPVQKLNHRFLLRNYAN